MTEKPKHGIPPVDTQLGSVGALPFAFERPISLTVASERLKKLANEPPRSIVDILWISEDKRRFHISSRAFRTHLIEADGYLTMIAAEITQVDGEIYGDYMPAMAIRLAALIIVAVFILLLMTGSLLAVVAGVAALGATIIHYRGSLRRTHEDQVQLAQMIEATLI